MKKVLILGCPGAGKSTFARKLRDKTGLPLYYLDMIWHKPDRTTITKQEFDAKLSEIIKQEEWIIDGNYGRTLEMRFKECDTVFFLDLPTNVCLAGVEGRIGSEREDMPWQEEELSAEFRNFIINFSRDEIPEINEMLRKYKNKNIIVINDDISLDVGRIRVRPKGSAGGHNGLKSIIYRLNSDTFPRVKMGVGAPKHEDYDLADFVLGRFTKEEIPVMEDAIVKAEKAVAEIIKNGVQSAMNKYNGK